MKGYLDTKSIALGYKSYADYLLSEHWQLFIASNRKEECFCCKYKERLQVHHIFYNRLGCELPSDVVTVCYRCHNRIHKVVRSGVVLDQAHLVVANKLTTKPKKGGRWEYMKLHNPNTPTIRISRCRKRGR
jgi:hypothetical protein